MLERFSEKEDFIFYQKRSIEIVFNLKHYASAFVLSIIFIFKLLQFVFFGISSFFNYVSFKNEEVVKTNLLKLRL